MDAISFVLGVSATEVRGTLKELVSRAQKGDKSKLPDCYVKLYLTTPDGELELSRHITKNGQHAEYRIDDTVFAFKDYEERLAEMNVNIRARNFLAFQVSFSKERVKEKEK